MALLLVEGYQGIATATVENRYTAIQTTDPTIANTTPRYLGYHIKGGGTVGHQIWFPTTIVWPLYIEKAYCRRSGYLNAFSLDVIAELWGWQGVNGVVSSAACFGGVWANPGGIVTLTNGDGVVVDTSSKWMRCNQWQHIQISWNIDSRNDGADGQVEVYVDGVLFIHYDGPLVNNPNVGSTYRDQSEVTNIVLSGTTGRVTISAGDVSLTTDVVVCDSNGADHIGFQGDVLVETIRPEGDGNYSQFTPLSSTNVSNVDETTPDNDTTYNHSLTANHRDSYSMTDLVTTTGVVKAVMVNANICTPEAALIQGKIFLREAGTDADSTAFNINQNFVHRKAAFNTDANGTAWTIAQVNAMEAGVQRL